MKWFRKKTNKYQQDDRQEVPSMHLIPLNTHTKLPVIFEGDNERTLAAVTTNGRISFFPAESTLEQRILARIEERYPQEHYSEICTYVCVGVMLKSMQKDEAAFILEVWGFWEPMQELEHLYYALNSLGGRTVGDEYWIGIENYLSSEPVRSWVNALIDFLLKELNWKDYVDQALGEWGMVEEPIICTKVRTIQSLCLPAETKYPKTQ